MTPGEFLAFDSESANTSPQNLRWWKPSDVKQQGDGNMIVVEIGGLYEIQIAMFINGAMSLQRPSEVRASLQA